MKVACRLLSKASGQSDKVPSMKSYPSVCLIFSALFVFAAYGTTEAAKSAQDLVPFDVGTAGATASIHIHVSRLRTSLTHHNPDEIALMVLPKPGTQNDPHIREKYFALFRSLTGKSFLYEGDKPAESHEGITVQVTWMDADGKVLRQRQVYSDDGNSRIRLTAGASFSLDGMVLDAGDYVVTVKALSNDGRFDGTFQTGLCAGYIAE